MLYAMDSVLMHSKILSSLELLSTQYTGFPFFCCSVHVHVGDMLLEVPYVAILTTAIWACRSGLMMLRLPFLPCRRLWPPTPFHLICHLFCDDKTLVSLTLFLLKSRMFNYGLPYYFLI
jgi:hypothetical protein